MSNNTYVIFAALYRLQGDLACYRHCSILSYYASARKACRSKWRNVCYLRSLHIYAKQTMYVFYLENVYVIMLVHSSWRFYGVTGSNHDQGWHFTKQELDRPYWLWCHHHNMKLYPIHSHGCKTSPQLDKTSTFCHMSEDGVFCIQRLRSIWCIVVYNKGHVAAELKNLNSSSFQNLTSVKQWTNIFEENNAWEASFWVKVNLLDGTLTI